MKPDPTQNEQTAHPAASVDTPSSARRRLLGCSLKAAPVVLTAASLSALSSRVVAAGTLCMSMNMSNPEYKPGITCDVPQTPPQEVPTGPGSATGIANRSPYSNAGGNNANPNRINLPPAPR